MNREQAKVYAKLSRKELSTISSDYGKNADLIRAFANGAIIEVKGYGTWNEAANPSFSSPYEFRIAKAVDSLDGAPLTKAEKSVIRALRQQRGAKK